MSSPTCRQPYAPTRRRPRTTILATLAAGLLALTTVTGCGGADGLQGTLRTADTQGEDGAPMVGGWVALLTAEQAAAFWDQSGLNRPEAGDLAHVEGRVRHEAVAESGGTLIPVDDDGKFTTSLTGPRHLCVLREFPQVDVLRGCAEMDLPADGTLDITVGDDGVQATLRD